MLPIHHLVPLGVETRWSDLLATLIEADPDTGFAAMGLDPPLGIVAVEREAASTGRDRIDLLIRDGNGARAIIEVKVLSGLRPGQLDRYAEAFPLLDKRVVFLERLPSTLPVGSTWAARTWEQVLTQFTTSKNSWVSATAAAWREYMQDRVPRVNSETVWNDVPPGEDLVLAMRTRMAWVYGRLSPPLQVERDLVESSAGKSWVARMTIAAQVPRYLIRVEGEESLRGVTTPRGPIVKICLVQTGVTTSKGFDWEYLHKLWAVMAPTRTDWSGSPRPRSPHDQAGIARLRAKGAPSHLGIGFGERQAHSSGECMFGAQFRIPPTATLGEVAAQLNSSIELVLELAGTAR